MKYAQIKNNVIKNIIVLKDPSLEKVFTKGFDRLVRIDNLSPIPGIGWLHEGENFMRPQLTNPVASENIQDQIKDLKDKLNSIITSIAEDPNIPKIALLNEKAE